MAAVILKTAVKVSEAKVFVKAISASCRVFAVYNVAETYNYM